MKVRALFQRWDSLQKQLHEPQLTDRQSDALVDHALAAMQALCRTQSARTGDVILKLDVCLRELEAGPCDECDALLASALHDCMVIVSQRQAGGAYANDNRA